MPKPLLFDTQNPAISGFSTAHAYKYKKQAKMKRDSRKMTFLLISHQATLILEKHRFAHRPLTSEENRNDKKFHGKIFPNYPTNLFISTCFEKTCVNLSPM